MTMPNSSSEDEVAMAALKAVALKATRVCRQKCPLATIDMDFCVANIVAIPVLGPRMEEALRWVFEVLTFQRAHVTKTSVGLTDTTTFRGVRSWTTHGGNLPTKVRVMRLPFRIRQNVILQKKSPLTSRASAVHIWSWRRGRNSTISCS